LFRRARQGDRQAFGLLLRRYDPRLRRLAARLIAEPDRVDPVLSRAYLRAWRSVPIVVPPSSVAEWLYRIVYNACINEVRWAPDGPPPPPLPGPRVPLPLASAQRRLAGLRALNPEERVPLVLVDGEGFSLDATARILGRTERETAGDLTRARYRWRGLVSGEPTPLSQETVVELPPDPEALPPLAELAEVDETTELGGHVKVVKPNGDEDDAEVADDPHHVPPAESAPADGTPAPRPKRTSRSRSSATRAKAAATAATQVDAAPDAATPSDDAREN
jgi:RNA polymerase sigma-70 factor (ECF subfamily)